MNPADQRWWRDRESSDGQAYLYDLESQAAESPPLVSAATAAVAVAAVANVAVAAASVAAAAADTAVGEDANGEMEIVPAEHETLCGLDDSWSC